MSERFTYAVPENRPIFAVEGTGKTNVQEVFGALPVAAGVDLGNFSSLLPSGIDTSLLKKQVEARYEVISQRRRAAGFYENIDIGTDLAIALLDNRLYEALLEEESISVKTIEVARHETGHGLVAANLGWHVKSLTVVPKGDYLGLTESIPPEGLSFSDWLLESAAISFGGKIAAMVSGDDVSGIGSDMASVAAKARIAVSLPGSRFSSEEAFIREAENIASRAISSVGASALNREALLVFHKQTMAA